jgi:hypothetical protein
MQLYSNIEIILTLLATNIITIFGFLNLKHMIKKQLRVLFEDEKNLEYQLVNDELRSWYEKN